MRTGRRLVAVAALGLLVPTVTVGCFGRFDLTRKVYRFNADISNDKWVRWVAFLVMVVVPVYGFSAALDTLFLNSVHFWTGTRLVSDTQPHVEIGPNGEIATSMLREDGSIALTISHPDGRELDLVLVREANALAAYDARGGLIARVGDIRGQPGLLEPAR